MWAHEDDGEDDDDESCFEGFDADSDMLLLALMSLPSDAM